MADALRGECARKKRERGRFDTPRIPTPLFRRFFVRSDGGVHFFFSLFSIPSYQRELSEKPLQKRLTMGDSVSCLSPLALPGPREKEKREKERGKDKAFNLFLNLDADVALSTSSSSTSTPPPSLLKQRRKSEMHRCEVCQTWLKNHPAVIAMHEQGAGHKAAVAKSKCFFVRRRRVFFFFNLFFPARLP